MVTAFVVWLSRDRLSAFRGLMILLASGFVASAGFLVGAHALGLALRSSWPGGSMVSPLHYAWGLGMFPLLAALFLMRERSARSAFPLSGKNASGGAGFAAAVTFFYAGVVLSILFVGLLPFPFSRDSAYLLGVGLMLVVSPFVGMAAASALRRVRESGDTAQWKTLAARFKAGSVVAWLLALPVIGFAVFFLLALFGESGGWNPNPAEAVLVPLTWLGAILLPVCGWRLWGAATPGSRPGEEVQSEAKGGRPKLTSLPTNRPGRFVYVACGLWTFVLVTMVIFKKVGSPAWNFWVSLLPVLPLSFLVDFYLRFRKESQSNTSGRRRESAQTASNIPRQDWGTWSPLQSPEVAAICSHLTKAERNHMSVLGLLFAAWIPGTIFGLPLLIRSFPAPGNWIVASIWATLFIVSIPMLQRMVRHFLCSTEWARQQNFTPEKLRLFSFRGGNLGKAGAVLAVGLLIIFAQNKAIRSYLGKPEVTPAGIGAVWSDHLRLNQVIAPGSQGVGRYGDDEFGFNVLFNDQSFATTVRYRKERGAEYRVQIEEKGGGRRALDEGGVVRSVRDKGRHQDVEEQKVIDRAAFERIAAFVLQKKTGNRAVGRLGFSPVIERTVEVSMPPLWSWFDIDIGQSVWAAQHHDANMEAAEYVGWTNCVGADFRAVEQAGRCGLDAGNTGGLLAPADQSYWDSLSADMLPSLIAHFSNQVMAPRMLSKSELPATLAFKSREGNEGVLQITGFTENPRGVQIRYKLVSSDKSVPTVPTKTIVLVREDTQLIQTTPVPFDLPAAQNSGTNLPPGPTIDPRTGLPMSSGGEPEQRVAATNFTRTVGVWTDSTVLPGETLRALVRKPDGTVVNAENFLSTRIQIEKVSTSVSFSWFFKEAEGFGAAEAERATAQIREHFAQRPVTLRAQTPLELFCVTNSRGGTLAGFIQYEKPAPVPPDADGKVKVKVTIQRVFGFGPMIGYSAKVPPGYALRATTPDGEASTHTPAGPEDFSSSWRWPFRLGPSQASLDAISWQLPRQLEPSENAQPLPTRPLRGMTNAVPLPARVRIPGRNKCRRE